MSAVSINAKIVAVGNNFSYVSCNPAQTIAIDCNKATVKGEWYMIPYPCQKGICYQKAPTSQTAYDIKVVEVETEDGVTYYLNGALSDYTDKCNSCCGSTPELTAASIVPYVVHECICADADGNYVFNWYIPTVGATQTFKLAIYIGGTAGSPALSTALASPAAALSYANSNWSAYGTWTLVGNTLTLTSTSECDVALVNTLQASDYCLAPTFPVTFDEILRDGDNGATITYTLPAPVTCADNVALKAALTAPVNYFPDGTFSTAVSGKLGYNGTGMPVSIKLAGVGKGTWTHAVCS